MVENTLLIQKNGLTFKVVKSKYQDFWEKVNDEQWEPQTFKVFDRFISKNVTYIDVGTWIGPTLLYAAQLAKEAFAFEPDPVAYQEMLANVKLNPNISTNIKTYEALIGIESGEARLGSREEGGDSMSSILFSDLKTSWLVKSINLQDFVKKEGLQPPLFIKVDIEGGEYSLIPTLAGFFKDYQPIVLYLSLHPEFLAMSTSSSNTLLGKANKWIKLITAHIHLARSLGSFKFIYDIHGDRTSIWAGLLKTLSNNNSIAENAIIATNEVW
ncbi:MAG: FkbM family methyltransferase [Nostoc sp. ChiSLP01]|nr:FkbM family methyltransferase [Nostoc sp. CmiSLP01]MDZ8285139.1 FkbM family methyltransferase [Nostoc sp. ChiSLP01]